VSLSLPTLPDMFCTPLVSTVPHASGVAPSPPSGWLTRPATATQAGLELNSAALVHWALLQPAPEGGHSGPVGRCALLKFPPVDGRNCLAWVPTMRSAHGYTAHGSLNAAFLIIGPLVPLQRPSLQDESIVPETSGRPKLHRTVSLLFAGTQPVLTYW
jgi:hypothetical protein